MLRVTHICTSNWMQLVLNSSCSCPWLYLLGCLSFSNVLVQTFCEVNLILWEGCNEFKHRLNLRIENESTVKLMASEPPCSARNSKSLHEICPKANLDSIRVKRNLSPFIHIYVYHNFPTKIAVDIDKSEQNFCHLFKYNVIYHSRTTVSSERYVRKELKLATTWFPSR